jgi:hypothetical protein
MALNLNKGCKLGKYFYQKDKVTYGPIPLEDLLERINKDTLVYCEGRAWSKAADVPELKGFFKSENKFPTQKLDSEADLPSKKINVKPILETKVKDTPPVISTVPLTSTKSSNGKKIAVALFLLLLTVGVVGYFVWYKPYLKDKNAARMYSFASSLSLRSTPVPGVDYNAIGNVLYGSEILVYSNSGEWSACKYNSQEGYVSSRYLLNRKDFILLNGIFADADTKEAISTSKCRKALVDYYISKGILSKMDEQLRIELFDSVVNHEMWQIFAKNKELKPNAFSYPRVVSPKSKFTDFACIITNTNTNKRRFLLFSFNDLEEAKLESDQEAPDAGYIDKISKSTVDGYDVYNVLYAN